MLNIKEKIEDQKKLSYAEAINELEREKLHKIKLLEDKENTLSSFRKAIEESIKPAGFMIFNDYIELVKRKIKAQEKVIEQAELKAEKKRLELVEAVKERKMLETLREKEYTRYLAEEKSAEQKQTDEVVSYQYNKHGG